MPLQHAREDGQDVDSNIKGRRDVHQRPSRREDQREAIQAAIELGTYELMLERHYPENFKCAAVPGPWTPEGCIMSGNHLRAPVFNVKAKYSRTRYRERFADNYFHVLCLERIGIDVPKFIELQAGVHFHPAILDWVTRKGRAFDVRVYDEYAEVLGKEESRRLRHEFFLGKKYYCEPPNNSKPSGNSKPSSSSKPASNKQKQRASFESKPKSQDFFKGEPKECWLSDVIMQIKEVDETYGHDTMIARARARPRCAKPAHPTPVREVSGTPAHPTSRRGWGMRKY